jgi:hypothetical protein
VATTRGPAVTIANLNEFRRALKKSQTGAEKELRHGLKSAGEPVIAAARRYAPVRSGALSAGYSIRTAGVSAMVANRQPYAAGAEWGTRGKWEGFNKYPGIESNDTGRFAWRAVMEEREEIAARVSAALREIITLQGWASE